MSHSYTVIARLLAMVCIVIGTSASGARAVGEPVNGFPNWAERVIHEWINRARVDPQLEMNACGSPCVERSCYGVMPPLVWNESLNRSARFHSDEMIHQSYFAHSSACTLVQNIDSLYPTSCNGAASCACVGGVKACSPTCTDFAQRVELFGGSPSGEIIASPSNPDQAFYLWLFEPGDTTSCQFTSSNGHRWLILKSTGAVGAGVAGYSTGDFGAGSAPTKIPSGSHYPQQASSVAMWANWYDTAGPTAANVNVDGTCTAMSLQRGTQTDGAWSATVSGVGTGCHRYYFSFRDSHGAAVTYPTTGSLAVGSGAACPDWDSARPADCAGAPTWTPSATPTPTAMPTQTRTSTRTASATATASASATATRTATASATSTASPLPTATASSTPSGLNVSGDVRYYSSDLPVSGVTVNASGPSRLARDTDASGHYVLPNVAAANVVVSPERSGSVGNAASALDAAYVLQYVAGLRTLTPEQRLACDVTGNGSLSSLDAAMLLQYSVGLLARFPVAAACNSDWGFIPNPASAPNQTVIPLQANANGCTSAGIAYDSLVASADAQNFAAFVFGDCTGNWQPGGNAATSAAFAMRSAARSPALRHVRGNRWMLPITLDGSQPVFAVQMRVTYDATALRAVQVRPAGRARGATWAVNTDQPGVVRTALATGEAIAPGRRPIAVIMFDALGEDPPAPAVATQIDQR